MKAQDLKQVQRILWAAADEMRANSSLAPAEYRGPVLAYAEQRFDEITPKLEGKKTKRRSIVSQFQPWRNRLIQVANVWALANPAG
jgi:type I restriction enzyme M protein